MAFQRQRQGERYFSVRDSTELGRRPPLVLTSPTKGSYEVMSVLGQGAFGKVVKCTNTDTKRTVAVKMVKSSIRGAKRERSNSVSCSHASISGPKSKRLASEGGLYKGQFEILKRLQKLCFDPDEHNFVRCFHFFNFSGFYCLVFERLHMSLSDFMSRYQPLSLGTIRPIVQQVATALKMLKRAGIVHTDLKPDNIMLVDHHRQPLRVKVIDFGCACSTSKVKRGTYVQTRWYRSPEILLGLSFTEAIDMWSLGCVAAELFLGAALYPGGSEYDMMRFITETQGPLPARLLHDSSKTDLYFTRDRTGFRRLKTPVEARVQSVGTRVYNVCSLDAIKDIHPSTELKGKYLRAKDRHHFVDLLKQMLQMDPGKRIEPDQVLQHPFVTMSHLVESLHNSSFVRSCNDKMSVCQTQRVTAPTERKRTSSEAAPTERKRTSSEEAESSPDRKRGRCEHRTGTQDRCQDVGSSL